MKKYAFILLLAAMQVQSGYAQQKINRDSVLKIMNKVAKWQLNTWHTVGMNHKSWDWTNGACYAGFVALGKMSSDPAYLNEMYGIGSSLNWNTGPNRLKADDYCVGQMFSQMEIIKKDPKMIAKFKVLADSIVAMPHTESLEWKNNVANREWAWCDALFMGPPALAYLSTATGNKKYLETAIKLWFKTTDYLFDKDENLYFRDSCFFI